MLCYLIHPTQVKFTLYNKRYIIRLVAESVSDPTPTSPSEEEDTTCQSPEACLKRDLFEFYDPSVRPASNPAFTVDVNVTMTVIALHGIVSVAE